MQNEFEQPYYLQLREFLKQEYASKAIYPDAHDIYNALHLTSYENTKVVILGQDPYHRPGQAHGLSFSVKPGVRTPPSLVNIYKELQTDLGCYIPNNGFLEKWAKQGVLLLNNVLTVREGKPNSHKNKGWEKFTSQVIQTISKRKNPVVFILWGRHAQEKKKLITGSHHLILEAVHPSPLSASGGFFGSRPFSQANAFLKKNNMKEIDWQIENI